MNNKTKVCQSIRSLILGKAKIISFEDIKVAQAAHAAKEIIKGKRKYSRKHKNAALETDKLEADKPEADKPELESEPEPEVAHAAKEIIKGRGKHGRKHKIAAQETDKPEPEPEPEMAQMIDAPMP